MSTDNAGPSAPPPPPAPTPSSTDAFFDSLRRTGMPRTTDRWIGGVAAGVARRLNIDPLIVRGVLVVMTLFGGLGLFVYGVAWALLPEETDGRIHLQEAFRGRFDAALAGSIAFMLVGVSRLGFWWDSVWWGGEFFGTLVVLASIALVIWLIVMARRNGNDRRALPPQQPYGPAGPGPDRPDQYGPSTWAAAAPGAAGQPAAADPSAGFDAAAGFDPASGPSTTAAFASGTTSTTPASGPASQGEGTVGTSAMGTSSMGTTSTGTSSWGTSSMGTTSMGTGTAGTSTAGPGVAGPAAPSTAGWTGTVPPSYTAATAGSGAGRGTPSGAAWTPPPPPPPRPVPVPAKPATPGPGRVLTRTVLGLSLVAIAALWLLDYVGGVDVGGWLTGVGVVLALFGIGVLVAGLLGRRSGVIGGLAIVIALIGVPWAAIEGSTSFGDYNWTSSGSYGNAYWTPQDAAELADGFDDIAGGEVTVDLTDLDGTVRLDEPVQIGVGAGQVNLRLPEGMSVRIEAQVLGEVVARTSEGWEGGYADATPRPVENTQWQTRGNRGVVLTSPAGQLGEPDLTIVIDAGVGEIRIIEESA